MLAPGFRGFSTVVKCWLQGFRILEAGFTRGFGALPADQLAVLLGRFEVSLRSCFQAQEF